MMPNDRGRRLDPDTLTPEQTRRLTMWRALTDLSRAQADGKLTPDEVRLLESLAESLQHLATQMAQLAELGKQYADALESGQAASGERSISER